MKGFNPTEWAIRHKALVIYFMLVCLVAGFSAYQHLGRNEDPEFTVKTMVVQTLWPGATQEETMQQVTDRIEKKLQDTPNLYYLKSYTVAGTSTVFVYLLESTPKKDVPDLWYQVRKKVGDIRQTLPQGIVGPFFNDEFGDTYGIIYGFMADGFSHRELRDYAEEARSRLLRVKDVSKAEFLGTQDERIYVEFSTHRLAELGMDRTELIQALVTQNAVVPSGVVQTKNEALLVDVTGRFESEKDLQQVNFVFGGKMLRLGDIATITRGYADPPQPKFRVNGKDAIGVALSMRTGGDILALEKNLDHVMEELKADLPVGIETFLVSNQPKVVEEAVNEFMKALWEAIAIVLVISFLNLGLRPGFVVAASIPLVLAIVFIVMQICGIDLQRISLGALIIALGLLVDDAMITIEAMVSKVDHGWDRIKAGIFAYASTAYPRLTGTLVIALGFVPVGFAKSSAGEYTFTLFAVVVIAVLTSWVVAALFTPLIGTMLLKGPKPEGTRHHEGGGRLLTGYRRLLLVLFASLPPDAISVRVGPARPAPTIASRARRGAWGAAAQRTAGTGRLLRSGMALLALTLGCVVLIGEAVPAVIGFALCGLGIANAVPLLFSAAGRLQPPGPSLAAAFTLGYTGFIVGPPRGIGIASDRIGLPHTLLLLVGAALTVAVLGGRAVGQRVPKDDSVHPTKAVAATHSSEHA